jgi:hypothetical protein
MKRSQLEHILRASSAITGADEIVVIGSESLLGQYPDPAPELSRSIEADVFTFRSPRDAELIDGSIGEGSPFHQTFGYYAHGVGEETATLPGGWKERLIRLRTSATGGATGLCLEAHDLAVSKLVAGRPKDFAYVAAMLRHGLGRIDELRARLATTALEPRVREICLSRLDRLSSGNAVET